MLDKARVKRYQRSSSTGKLVTVREHDRRDIPSDPGIPAPQLGIEPIAPNLVEYLSMVEKMRPAISGRAYGSMEECLLRNGRAFRSAPLPTDVKPGRLGLCYMNAYRLADQRSDLTYCEGYVTVMGIPIAHAWTVDRNGTVVDPTLGNQRVAKDWAQREYFGLPFSTDYVRKTILARGKYGVLYNPEQHFPIMQEGLKTEDLRLDLGKAPVGKPQMTEEEFIAHHKTGWIPSDAYDRYKTSDGIASFVKRENYPNPIATLSIDGVQVDILEDNRPVQYVKIDPNDDLKIVRDEQGMAVMMTKEEVEQAGKPSTAHDLAAFVGNIPIGFASNEFGTAGVWVVEPYQHKGLGTYLLSEFMARHPHIKKIGQMTSAGEAMTRAYYRMLAKQGKLAKAKNPVHVQGHMRATKTGRVVPVQSYTEQRNAAKESPTVAAIDRVKAALKREFPEVDHYISAAGYDPTLWTLHDLVVKKEMRGQGLGSRFMERLVELADTYQATIVLSPAERGDNKGTTSRNRLIEFYERFAFVRNKGRKKDYRYSDLMYRRPIVSDITKSHVRAYDRTSSTGKIIHVREHEDRRHRQQEQPKQHESHDTDRIKFAPVDAQEFVAARDANSKRSVFLSPHTAAELEGKKLFLSPDRQTGYLLDEHGDLQNVFNNGGPKGAGKQAIEDAIRNGATTLDCFDGFLPDLYARYGFVETGRMKFNPDYKPDGWDMDKLGQPDVVFMAYQGGNRADIHNRIGTFTAQERRTSVYATDWDAAKADSRRAVRDAADDRQARAAVRAGSLESSPRTDSLHSKPVTPEHTLADSIYHSQFLYNKDLVETHDPSGEIAFRSPDSANYYLQQIVSQSSVENHQTTLRAAVQVADTLRMMKYQGYKLPDTVIIERTDGGTDNLAGRTQWIADKDESGKSTQRIVMYIRIPSEAVMNTPLNIMARLAFGNTLDRSGNRKMKAFSIKSFADIVVHEMGHVQANYRLGGGQGTTMPDLNSKPGPWNNEPDGKARWMDEAAYDVSKYAAKNTDEFLAEAFTVQYRGEKLTKNAQILYDALDGPKVKA